VSPVVVWTIAAGIGVLLDLWNGYWALHDLHSAGAANGSLLRLPRITLAKHNFWTELLRLISQVGFLYVGIKSWGLPAGAWNDVTIVIVVAASSITLNAARGTWVRIKLDQMLNRAEPKLKARKEK
jgi:hypothetical protein